MENSETLHQSLKKQTVDLHEKAHQIPYISNLLKGSIPLESYIGHLRAAAIIYGTLEQQLSTMQKIDVSLFLNGYTPKLPCILADLDYLNAKEVKDIMPAVSNALHIADKILMYSEKSPFKLLGFLYTLDGSLNGGSVFMKHLSEQFNLKGSNGLSYFSVFNGEFKHFWSNFTEKLNTLITEDQAKDEILSGSREIFNDIMGIYECLFPIDEKQLGNHITSLNPEAGNFPISTNPLEIKAAITAGFRCWNEFSFFEKRYGDRGKRFTVSDSVWLVNLCDLSQELANNQVVWLAKYLAGRGMPTFTEEKHLEYLYHELVKLIPENEAKYRKLLYASVELKKQRTEKLPLTDFENSNSMFHKLWCELKVTDAPMENTGKLIASSVADHRNGIGGTEHDYRSWITNPALFSQNWIMAVEKAYSILENQPEP